MMDRGNLIVLITKKRQNRKLSKFEKDKRMSNVADSGEEHSIIWWMFMAATFMGRNFVDNQNSIKNFTDLTLKKMFDISEKFGERTGRDQQFGQDSFMETTVVDWWRNRYQFSTRKSLHLFRFCVVPWKGPWTSGNQRFLEEKDWNDRHWQKLQRLWRNQWRADWIRVEHLPRIWYVAALW